jgi:hypothetical protein
VLIGLGNLAKLDPFLQILSQIGSGWNMMVPSHRAPDYRVVAAWSGFLFFIGAGAFVLGMAIHNEATAKPPTPRPEPIYYCATGEEIPLYEPCKERKDERNI